MATICSAIDTEFTTADVSKGNLRDTQGSTVVFDGTGVNYPLHNWALLQQGVIA